MTWKFDQAPNVACITSQPVIDGASVLIVTHYEDDHSWAFLDGQEWDMANALVVTMSSVLNAHPELQEIADLPPGWTASRTGLNQPWSTQQDDFDDDA